MPYTYASIHSIDTEMGIYLNEVNMALQSKYQDTYYGGTPNLHSKKIHKYLLDLTIVWAQSYNFPM